MSPINKSFVVGLRCSLPFFRTGCKYTKLNLALQHHPETNRALLRNNSPGKQAVHGFQRMGKRKGWHFCAPFP